MRKKVYPLIYNSIRSDILSGKNKPGDMLPSENQLCKKHSASRETVRKALKQLETDHFIYSKPKVGYYVSSPRSSEFVVNFTEYIKDCETKYKDIRPLLPDEKIQTILDLDPEQIVIEFEQLTISPGNEVIGYTEKYIPYKKAKPSVESEMNYSVFPDITFPKMDSFSIYTSIRISAVSADKRLSEILECEEKAPLLLVERYFIQQDAQIVGYAANYLKQPYGILNGMSGIQ